MHGGTKSRPFSSLLRRAAVDTTNNCELSKSDKLSVLVQSDQDKSLVLRLKQQDPEVLGEVYDTYGALVYTFLCRFVTDRAVAEDLAQEIFLRVWRHAADLDPQKGSLKAWLLRSARNRAIDYMRRRKLGPVANYEYTNALETAGIVCDPEEQAINTERAGALKEAMSKLNVQQREVIDLAFYEGLSQSAIAGRLNRPLGTVKTQVRSALLVLRKQL